MRREARASRYRVAAFAPRARECPPTVARVRPSLDPFQCGRPEIYSGIARSWPIYARVTTSETPLRGPRGSGARATWSLRLGWQLTEPLMALYEWAVAHETELAATQQDASQVQTIGRPTVRLAPAPAA